MGSYSLSGMERVRSIAHRYGFDFLIAVAAIGGALEVAFGAQRTSPWIAVPAIASVVLVLLGRRYFPFGAPASVWLGAAALSFVEGRLVASETSIFLAGMAAGFLLGNLRSARQARIGLAILVGSSVTIVWNDPNNEPGNFIFIPVLFASFWLAGFAVREWSTQAEMAEERADHAERERESAARLAVAEERARIARELHDIVAHAVSVMVLQVGAVRHKLPPELVEDADALRGVERTGRSALAEMRLLLGAMRREDESLELGPQPGLGSLEALVEEVERAGLPVQLRVEGPPVALSPAIDLSAYRIVQEGLTNALKHSRASQAGVVVAYAPSELRIEVRDDGQGGSTSDGDGHGLVGVRERVKIYGGEMTAGAIPEGGFVLRACLPLEAERS